MLFRKKIEPRCAYCKHASPAGTGIIICKKHGVSPETEHCRAFRYDPLKRVPSRPKLPDFDRFQHNDFEL